MGVGLIYQLFSFSFLATLFQCENILTFKPFYYISVLAFLLLLAALSSLRIEEKDINQNNE